jgi:hypothetical protein
MGISSKAIQKRKDSFSKKDHQHFGKFKKNGRLGPWKK